MFPKNLIVENLLRRGELLCYDYLKEQKTLNHFLMKLKVVASIEHAMVY